MKYMVKGELEVKVGDSVLLPGGCDFHIGTVLSGESMALIPWHTGFLPCLGLHKFPRYLPHDWWV